ncbi:MAG: LysE family translocator [Pseudomonadota bacterium]
MSIAGLLIFAGVYIAAVASPGPAVLALIARVLARGRQGVGGFIAGCMVGDLIWFAMAVAGLAILAQTMQGVFFAIKWAGIVYLLYLAYKLWTAPVSATTKDAPRLNANGTVSMFFAGLALTLSNPKTMVFFLAVLPTVVDLTALSWIGFVEVSLIIIVTIPIVFAVYTWVFDRARDAVVTKLGVASVNKACAVGLAGAAGLVATR